MCWGFDRKLIKRSLRVIRLSVRISSRLNDPNLIETVFNSFVEFTIPTHVEGH